jgi:hypothetical protein
MAENLGVTSLGFETYPSIYASARDGRQINIILKGNQGILPIGTLLMKDSVTGKYIVWDNTTDIAGVLNEEFDTTAGDVKAYLVFDVDLTSTALFAASTINIGFNNKSMINIVGAD